MDIKDALNILQENKGGHLYKIFVPSLNKKIEFKQMTVAHHKTMAKMAIEDEGNFDKFICALITELSNGKVNINTINEIDKNYIMFSIKHFNSSSPITLNMKCGKCKEDFSSTPTLDEVINNKGEWKNLVVTNQSDDMKVVLEIGLPSVGENLIYANYCSNRKDQLEDDEIKHKLAVFIASYEMLLLCVRKITINDEEVTDFIGSPFEDRFNLIESLNLECLDIDQIRDYLEGTHKEYAYTINCPHCKFEFENLMSTENFFF